MRHRIAKLFAAPLLLTTLCVTAISAQQPVSKSAPMLLPPSFDGWIESGKPMVSSKAAIADPGNAAALTEYGFLRYAEQNYTRGSDSLAVKAVQFPDATGAYGAFTFYRRPNMAAEEIGTGGASDGSRVLFWSGTVLVDAQFSHINAMTAAEMRDLAKLLPAPTSGHSLIPPPLPRYLPTAGLEAMSVRYALGNSSYQLTGGIVPPQRVGFDSSAEAVTAQYSGNGGSGTLTLLEYPTPQLAMAEEKTLNDLINAVKSPQNGAQSLPESFTSSSLAALQVQRSGPLVALTSGSFSERQAQQLLGSIHYDANIIWNNTTGYIPETTKAARLLVNIILASSIICLISLALGIALGGGRALIRVLQGKPASAMDETFEFTKLNLRD
jgi:hypothetical protein